MKVWTFLLMLFWILMPNTGECGARLALVVANNDYEYANKLINPVRDAVLIEDHLEFAKFTVYSFKNVNSEKFQKLLGEFIETIDRYMSYSNSSIDAVLFYYAGHGVQIGGINYLLPVDAEPNIDQIVKSGVNVNDILGAIEKLRAKAKIIILDSCRDNPFMQNGRYPPGLSEVKGGEGTLIAYSTGPGEVALDGSGDNSPYARALSIAMDSTGVPIEAMFRTVRREVLRTTGGKQLPWETSSLTEEFAFHPTNSFGLLEYDRPDNATELELWAAIQTNPNRQKYQLYLKLFPNGDFGSMARKNLK